MSKSGKVLRISRNEISKKLQINGLTVGSEALSLLESELLNGYPPYQSIDDFISQISDVLVMNCRHNWFIIDGTTAQKAIDHLKESRVCRTADNELLVKNVITTSDQHFVNNNYLHHLKQLHKHLVQNKALIGTHFKITAIDDLITSTNESIDCIVFGFLFKDCSKISQYLIEDNSGRVPVAFSEDTQWNDSIIVENSFLIIEGTYYSRKDCLHVRAIGSMPPTINRSNTLSAHNVDGSDADAVNGVEGVGRMIIIISDIHLDNHKTLEKLKVLFTGYNSMAVIPDCFLLIGDFVSKQSSDVTQFKALMKNFVGIISQFNKLSKHSQFIFVPGFNDINADDIPKPQFSVDMFPTTTTKISNFYLATNPVNIYIDGRHICLSAFPYISKLNKHIIHNNTEDSQEFGTSIAKVIISNAHLTTGLNKSFQSSLSLFHFPDLLLITDYNIKETIDCNAYNYVNLVNIPSFTKDKFKFKVFYTNPIHTEDSQILV